MKPCILVLTCADDKEADVVAIALLNKKLIVCAKMSPITSKYYWKDAIESAEEVVMIMDSSEELFEQVETEVKLHHSYETINLVMLPVLKTSAGVAEWMSEGLSHTS